MRLAALFLAVPLVTTGAAAHARDIVDASAPQDIAVTVYRDPARGDDQRMNREWPQGFAMISETRQVTLPPGESTIRFTGVAEGMVAVSAIVTGLPGGTIEKNRNADLLSPAALVDGSLGNRVRITRTNPGNGEQATESAIIRTRADGGLVLETAEGFEAVRCSGVPERLSFDRVPDGLSAQPVFSIDTAGQGGTYTVTLTYLAWGFDWQADYVATLADPERGDSGEATLHLVSWLTILNDNGQSFENAELMAVAGTLNVESDFEDLADPPRARPLRLTCYPLGSSMDGTPEYSRVPPPPPPPPPAPQMMARALSDDSLLEAEIVVTGSKVMAGEEDLGDLKLYRIPERVTISAKGMKQVAFLDREDVEGNFLYQAECSPWEADEDTDAAPAEIVFRTVNDRDHGLGVAMPSGSIVFFEPTSAGELFVAERNLRDYATGRDVEIGLGDSAQVFARCEMLPRSDGEPDDDDWHDRWRTMRVTLTNANPVAADLRLRLGYPQQMRTKDIRTRVKDGRYIHELELAANSTRVVEWRVRER